MSIKYWFHKIVMVFLGIFMTSHIMHAADKKELLKLNNALIFDLFMNCELTEKNGNLATIVDFIPNHDIKDWKSVKISSNIGGKDQIADFIYNDKGKIEKISYEVNNKIYNYEFIYNGNLLSGVNIAGKKKISFEYDNKGRLITIIRDKGEASLEFTFEYPEGEKKANIHLNVIQGVKKSPSKRKYFVAWDSQFKLESYRLDVYSSKNIKYSDKGDLVSYSFASVNEDNNIAIWEYNEPDKKGNWIERTSKNILFKRAITYN